jgi:hypothetical protein
VAALVHDVCETVKNGVTDLIARAPETKNASHDLSPQQMAELIFAVNDGLLMREALSVAPLSDRERREQQLQVARRLWRLLFTSHPVPAYA